MDPFALIESAWWVGIPVAFVMGLFLGANPAALPVLGVGVGLSGAESVAKTKKRMTLAIAFGAGLVLVYALLGVGAARIDTLTESFLRPRAGIAYLVLASLLLVFGSFLLIRPHSFCAFCAGHRSRNLTVTGAFLAGLPAGFVNCPACAGIVTGVAGSSVVLGSPLYSIAVMLALGLGHALVVVVAAVFLTKGWNPQGRSARVAQRTVGVALIGLAAYFSWLAWINGFGSGPRLV
jgi:cytochrome c biogenesis protein CcdA